MKSSSHKTTAQITALRSALEFYANADNWEGAEGEFGTEASVVEQDGGDVANLALQEVYLPTISMAKVYGCYLDWMQGLITTEKLIEHLTTIRQDDQQASDSKDLERDQA